MRVTRFSTGLGQGDDLTPEESDRLRIWYRDEHGGGDPDVARFAPFLIDHRPRAFKRYRRHAEAAATTGLPAVAVPLLYAYVYLLSGYERGVLYEVFAARRWGATKDEVLDVVELAVLDGGASAGDAACSAEKVFAAWRADEPRAVDDPWPTDWPRAVPNLLDASSSTYVAFLEDEAPAAAESYRERFAGAADDFSLPAVLVPLMRLTAAAAAGRPESAVGAVNEARRLGCPRQAVVSTLTWASFGATPSTLDSVTNEIRPLLDDWPNVATTR